IPGVESERKGPTTMPIPPFREDGWLPVGHHAAEWDEIVCRFQGTLGSRREELTRKLLEFRDALRDCGISGSLLLNGTYVSAKEQPTDFDLLLIAPANIHALMELDPKLAALLDAEGAEKQRGYTLFYVPNDSPAL